MIAKFHCRPFGFAASLMLILLGALSTIGIAQAPLTTSTLKDLDGHFPFQPPASKESWEQRAKDLRQQLRVALGLVPYPTLAPLAPTVHGKRPMDGYSVEKVYFESLPGLFVTGTLYRPLDSRAANQPAVLCPHGHWDNGRFYEATPRDIKQLLATGAERFESAARNHMQARCVQLARMGCVVFQYDMLGYADSQQIPSERAHGFQKPTAAEQSNEDGWVLFSPEAEGYGQSVMALQTIHSLRCIDFVTSLPDVDPARIAITGASGGGTQSFIAAALDDRIRVACPAVMVSTGMQGGCTCENACGLRVLTGNVEIAALIAPRPLGMTAANDWTRTMPQDGYPELKKLYKLFDAENRVALYPSLHFGHNYNHVSRVPMYGWLNRHLGLNLEEPILERDFQCLGRSELTVWDEQHPMPKGGLDFERKLLRAWKEDIDRHFDAKADPSLVAESPSRKELLKHGWEVILQPAKLTQLGGSPAEQAAQLEQSGVKLHRYQVDAKKIAEPIAFDKANADWNSDTKKKFVWIVGDDLTPPQEFVQRCLAANGDIYVLNLQGTYTKTGQDSDSAALTQPLVKNPRRSAAYTFGYNAPVLIRQVTAAKNALMFLPQTQSGIVLGGTGRSGLIAAGVAFTGGDRVQSTVVVDDGYRLARAPAIDDWDFVPGALRYRDLPGLLECLGADRCEVIRAK